MSLAVAFTVLPVFYTVSMSLRDGAEVMTVPPRLFPPNPTIEPYLGMSGNIDVFRCIRNTSIVAAATTVIAVSFAALGAYTFARVRFRFADQLMVLLLVSQMFPGASIIVPLFKVLRELGLYNTHAGLIFVYTGFTIPFCTWMLYGYFKTIPGELEEAALIDGCSRGSALIRVILPLALPGVAATAVFVMLAAWNEFTFAVLFVQNNDLQLITPGLTQYIAQYRSFVQYMAAAAVTAALPPLAAFILVRRYFISGLVAGAIKG
jgi:ABC-type glycerol-3-phosphate transport system permease component